jgi:hypothetical protein
VYACFKRGAFTLGLDRGVDLFLRLVDHLFDPCGVDAAVQDELFKSQTRYLAPDGVEA